MDLIADRGRRVSIEELNSAQLLRNATKQARQRKFDDMLIVDVDAHHYENEHMNEILPMMENDVLRQLAMAGRSPGWNHCVCGTVMPAAARSRRYSLSAFQSTVDGGFQRPPGVSNPRTQLLNSLHRRW